MIITLDIPAKVIANLVTSAIEGGDPVTTASRGGWCNGLYWNTKEATPPRGPWYANANTFVGHFQIEVHEIADENKMDLEKPDAENVASGALVIHKISQYHVNKGLVTMARVFPHQFCQIIRDDIDAPCADAFLQSILFGEEKYA